MGVQVLADMSYVERKLALERYKLLEPHSQNGRELRSASKLYSRIGFVHEFRPLLARPRYKAFLNDARHNPALPYLTAASPPKS
jgi:hypothetical protein